MGCGNFVKVEIMRDTKYLLPDNYETVKATEILAKEGFVVLAIYESGSEYRKRSAKCRSRSCYAIGSLRSVLSKGTGNKRDDPDTD